MTIPTKNIFSSIKNNYLCDIPKILSVIQKMVEIGNKKSRAFFNSKSSELVKVSDIGIAIIVGIVPEIMGEKKNFYKSSL
jgi:hypothetical protein